MTQAIAISTPATAFRVEINTGNGSHVLVSDVSVSSGGSDDGPAPTELLAGALAACVCMTLKNYARMKSWGDINLKAVVSIRQVDDPNHPGQKIPEFVEDIEVVSGTLDQSQLSALMRVAARCHVQKLLTEPKLVSSSVKLTTPTVAPAVPSGPSPSNS